MRRPRLDLRSPAAAKRDGVQALQIDSNQDDIESHGNCLKAGDKLNVAARHRKWHA